MTCALCGNPLNASNRSGLCFVCRYESNDAVPLELSVREKEILRLASDGNNSDSIAVKLDPPTTEQVVKNRLRYIRRKLDSGTTLEACCKALRRGLLV